MKERNKQTERTVGKERRTERQKERKKERKKEKKQTNKHQEHLEIYIERNKE